MVQCLRGRRPALILARSLGRSSQFRIASREIIEEFLKIAFDRLCPRVIIVIQTVRISRVKGTLKTGPGKVAGIAHDFQVVAVSRVKSFELGHGEIVRLWLLGSENLPVSW